jgi:hypothetical protein
VRVLSLMIAARCSASSALRYEMADDSSHPVGNGSAASWHLTGDGRIGSSSVCCRLRHRLRRNLVCIDGGGLLHRRALGFRCQQEDLRPSAAEILRRTCASLGGTHPRLTVMSRVEDGVPERTLVDASTDTGLPGHRIKWPGAPSNDDPGLDGICRHPTDRAARWRSCGATA